MTPAPGIIAAPPANDVLDIDTGDRSTGYVDFHSLRKTLSTMLATAGMSQRVRQSHMRHTDPRLTENTYMDDRLLPVADELFRVPAIGSVGPDVRPTPEPTLTTDIHRKSVALVLELSGGGNEKQEPELEMLVQGPASQVALLQAVGQLLSSNDKASHQKGRGLIKSG